MAICAAWCMAFYMKKDLVDVCNYMKALVIPNMPDDFIVAEPFRHGLTDDEMQKGIAAFHSFLCGLYDRLAGEKDRFDAATGTKYAPGCGEDSIYKCFPVISGLALILFSMGIHGKLETEPRKELTVNANDLFIPHKVKSEKYYSLHKISARRKLELFSLLSDMGFYFEDADFSEEADLSKTGTFYVSYENDDDLLVGLKLIAQAQANIKSDYDKLMAAFMRCDFYPLANTAPKVQVVHINEFINPQSAEIKEWIIGMDGFLLENGCKVLGEINQFTGGAYFSYTSKKSKSAVCRFNMGITGCTVNLKGNHLANPNNILKELPPNMLAQMMVNDRVCSAEGTPKCQHERYRFTYNDETYYRCRYAGFHFSLEHAGERELIQKWIEYELAM
jgi:hypothetical protein